MRSYPGLIIPVKYGLKRGRKTFVVDDLPLFDQANSPVSSIWGPTIRLIHNGGNKAEAQCLVCGSCHSWCAKYRIPKHAFVWFHEHNHECSEISG